jgi:hypothetical protein
MMRQDVDQQMSAMVTGHWTSQVVRAAVDLSLADHLAAHGLTAAEVAEREGAAASTSTDVVAGDFFESVPSGDLYLLKFILHDRDDERAIAIRRADGHEQLAIVPGQERSLEEYDALLGAAGLRRTAVSPTSSPQSVIEAVASAPTTSR